MKTKKEKLKIYEEKHRQSTGKGLTSGEEAAWNDGFEANKIEPRTYNLVWWKRWLGWLGDKLFTDDIEYNPAWFKTDGKKK